MSVEARAMQARVRELKTLAKKPKSALQSNVRSNPIIWFTPFFARSLSLFKGHSKSCNSISILLPLSNRSSPQTTVSKCFPSRPNSSEYRGSLPVSKRKRRRLQIQKKSKKKAGIPKAPCLVLLVRGCFAQSRTQPAAWQASCNRRVAYSETH